MAYSIGAPVWFKLRPNVTKAASIVAVESYGHYQVKLERFTDGPLYPATERDLETREKGDRW